MIQPPQESHTQDPPLESNALGPLLSDRTDERRARRRELEQIEARLAHREVEIAALRVGLRAFTLRYRRALVARYAELDRVQAEIAETLANLSPDDPELRLRAEKARTQADESTAEIIPPDGDDAAGPPNDDLKRLYRRVAFAMHPDRCGAKEALLSHDLMVEANRAYKTGDAKVLEALLAGARIEDQDGADPDLAWIVLHAERARQQLLAIERETEKTESSDIYRFWKETEAASAEGRDLLKEETSLLDRSIAKARARLEILRTMV